MYYHDIMYVSNIFYYSLDRNAGRSLVETSHVTDQYYEILVGKK